MKRLFLFCLVFFFFSNVFGQLNTGAAKIIEQISIEDSLTLTNLEEYITKETIEGKLDFNKLLENEKSILFLYDGVAYNKKDFAILLWGRKVKFSGFHLPKKGLSYGNR